ncbi:hypothetical protein VPH209E381_0097 [Vibrio phage 209E38-1]
MTKQHETIILTLFAIPTVAWYFNLYLEMIG